MSEEQGSAGSEPEPGQPPRAVLYALYLVMALVLIAVLVIVGVYGV